MRQGDESVSDDRYVTAIDKVEQSARAAHDALDRAVETFRLARQERVAGVPHAEIVKGLLARGGGDTDELSHRLGALTSAGRSWPGAPTAGSGAT